MAASLFGTGGTVNVNVNGTLVPQSFTATGGQTVFNLSDWTYTVGTNSLLVFINGQRQILGRDFTETSSTSFTLLEGCIAGDYVDVIGFPQIELTAVNSGVVSLGGSYNLSNYISDSTINLKAYPYSAKTDGTDTSPSLQLAINTLTASGGGTIYIPPGTYTFLSSVQMKEKVRILGAGTASTILTWNTVEDGIASAYPINSSTAAWNQVKDLQLRCTNNFNTGGGYVDVGGSYVYLENVYCNGFKYGAILDQTELADIDLCNFGNNLFGGVWLVNGAAHSPGASGVFTNRISINRCQFNNSSTSYGIIDDGGYSHSFTSNNFNSCFTALRSAGTQGLSIKNNYFEGQSNFCIDLQSTTVAGVGCGQNTSTLIETNLFVPIVANTPINAAQAAYLSVINNDFATPTTPVKIAIGTVAQFVEVGNRSAGGGALTGGTPSWQFRAQDTGTFTPVVKFSGANVGVTYATQSGSYTRIGNVVTFAINITLTSKGSSAGTLQITGLPYTSAALNQIISAPYINNVLGGITTAASNIAASGTTLTLFNAAVNASNVFLDTNVSNNTTINITGSYLAA